jgi:hypothetical protein
METKFSLVFRDFGPPPRLADETRLAVLVRHPGWWNQQGWRFWSATQVGGTNKVGDFCRHPGWWNPPRVVKRKWLKKKRIPMEFHMEKIPYLSFCPLKHLPFFSSEYGMEFAMYGIPYMDSIWNMQKKKRKK